MGYLCANFSLPRLLCSRLRPDVRDRQTSDVHHRLMPPGAGHNERAEQRADLIGNKTHRLISATERVSVVRLELSPRLSSCSGMIQCRRRSFSGTPCGRVDDVVCRREVYHLNRELLRERTRVKALEEELENPMNIHRWRKLEVRLSLLPCLL